MTREQPISAEDLARWQQRMGAIAVGADLSDVLAAVTGAVKDLTQAKSVRLMIDEAAGGSDVHVSGPVAEDAGAWLQRNGLTTVFERLPDPVLILDRSLRVARSNPAARTLFPALTAQPEGQLLQTIADLADLADLIRAGEGQAVPSEFRVDDDRSYTITLAAVRAENGEPIGWAVILQDVTRFRRLHDNMADFLSTVSHDMRTPLTFMRGYLDMLGMVGEVNAKQAEFIGNISGGIVQMSDMVEKILKAGRLDPVTGTYKLERETCDITELVTDMVANLTDPAKAKRLDLTHHVGAGIPVLNVDRDLIGSAFMNLAENAVKYTPEGGAVAIALDVKDGALVFCVRDNGLGISVQDQQKLFRRNVRIHRKEWRRIKGSGLGLFIVKNVAQRHGGDVWVESAEGQGSTFYFSIPLDGANLVGGRIAPDPITWTP